METKSKRKYVRKPKPQTIQIEEPPVEQEPKEIPEGTIRLGYDKVAVYMYHEGTDIDTLKYIKAFQVELDKKRIGSQVIIVSRGEHVEPIGLNNCFVTADTPKQWFDLVLSNDTKLGIRFMERPTITPEELLELLIDKPSYSDNFVELKSL